MSIFIKCGMKKSMRVRMLQLIVLLSVIFSQALPVEGGTRLDRGTPTSRELDKNKKFTRRADLTLWGARQSDVSSKKILIYKEAFVVAYNQSVKRSLSRGGRKSLALRVTNIKFVPDSISPSDFSGDEITLSFDVTFTCKLCDSDSTLFRYDAPTRMLNVFDSQDVALNPEVDDRRHLSAGLFSAGNFTITYNNVLKSLAKANSLIPASKWSDINQGCTAASVCDPSFHLVVGAVAEVILTDAESTPSNRNRRNLATRLSVKVNVSFKCKACSSGSRLLRNDASRRRRQLKPSRGLVGGGKSQERTLVTSANSCTCPVGWEADVPTYSDLADQLDDYIFTNIPSLDAEVAKVKGITDESCPGTMITRFNFLSLDANGCSTTSDLIAVAIKTSLNDLLSKFCSTEFRTVASVAFSGLNGDSMFFIVEYTCRDCRIGTLLLDPELPATMFAASLDTGGDGNVRRLPEFNNVCYCNDDADDTRNPTFDEFIGAMFDVLGCTVTTIFEQAD
ncbi:hypothetical protein MHU86_8996 [Fragilaria crotonensis]|nr:hypothetical protein MHU86_8996 [Fragilaria crotonensis]